MHRNERLFNGHPEMPFYVSQLRKAYLKHSEGGTTIDAFLNSRDFLRDLDIDEKGMSKNPWIKLLTNRQNPSAKFLSEKMVEFDSGKDVQIATADNPVRWVGSGAMLVIKTDSGTQYAVLNKRFRKYAWPNHFDANGGYSSSDADMIMPGHLARREIAEELLITKDGRQCPIDLLEPKVVMPSNPVTAIVHHRGGIFKTDNLILIVDTETGTIDFRQILKISLANLLNLDIKDREDMFTSKTTKALQGRSILLAKVDELKNLIKTGKKVHPAKIFNPRSGSTISDYDISPDLLTPALRAILQNI